MCREKKKRPKQASDAGFRKKDNWEMVHSHWASGFLSVAVEKDPRAMCTLVFALLEVEKQP